MFELTSVIEYTGVISNPGGLTTLKTQIIALFVVSLFATAALAQGGGEYSVKAIKGNYIIIGEKPYKMLTKCEGIKPQDEVSFSESPITCLKATVVNLESLSECEVECITNTGTPYEPPAEPEVMEE